MAASAGTGGRPGRSPSADTLAIAGVVRRGASHLTRQLRSHRPKDDLSLTKLSVLGHLVHEGAMTAGALAAADGMQPQSLTRLLAELETEGLLMRSTDAMDRRRAVLSITQAGRQALAESMRPRDTWLAELLEELTPTERQVLEMAGYLMEDLAVHRPAGG